MRLAYVKLQNGTMTRLATGAKVIYNDNNIPENIRLPKWSDESNINYAESWRELDLPCPVAIHTGLSELCVLDFDDELFDIAMSVNLSLAPEFQCTNIAKSVNKPGGHFIYAYRVNKLTEYISNPNGRKFAKLDTLYGNTLVYATTARNATKEIIKQSDKLIPMPAAMQYLVIGHYSAKTNAVKNSTGKNFQYYQGSKLALLAMRAMDDGNENDLQKFLAIVTQPRHKELMAQSSKELPTLHPDRIPDGEGYNFLQSISAVLVLDPSIDKKLHITILSYLNNLYSTPLEPDRLMKLWESDCRKPEYKFNPNWNNETFSRQNRKGEQCEYYAYLEGGKYTYYKINTVLNQISKLKDKASLLEDLSIETTRVEKGIDVLSKIVTLDELKFSPMIPYGIVNNTILNLYKQNPEQITFYNPLSYRQKWDIQEQNMPYNEIHPRWPSVTLGALKNACGQDLPKFLSFMRRKFMTRDYSPVFFVFYGVPHSFKTGVVNGVFTKLAANRHQTIQAKLLLDKYNSWIVDMDLIMLDEVHHIPKQQLDEAIGVINTLTGTQVFTGIRKMYSDVSHKAISNTMTFIVCTNEQIQLTTEINERRMVVFKADKRLSEALNMDDQDIRAAIENESINFAYYLSTKVVDASNGIYTTNKLWKSDTYERFQQEVIKHETRMAAAIADNDYKLFIDLYIQIGGNKDDFNQCVEYLTGSRVNIRLYNSRPDIATNPGLFDNSASKIFTTFNRNKFEKMLNNLPNVSKYVNDNVNNQYTGNKKCVWKTDLSTGDNINITSDFCAFILGNEIKI